LTQSNARNLRSPVFDSRFLLKKAGEDKDNPKSTPAATHRRGRAEWLIFSPASG
jgi:hypothetical protein